MRPAAARKYESYGATAHPLTRALRGAEVPTWEVPGIEKDIEERANETRGECVPDPSPPRMDSFNKIVCPENDRPQVMNADMRLFCV